MPEREGEKVSGEENWMGRTGSGCSLYFGFSAVDWREELSQRLLPCKSLYHILLPESAYYNYLQSQVHLLFVTCRGVEE